MKPTQVSETMDAAKLPVFAEEADGDLYVSIGAESSVPECVAHEFRIRGEQMEELGFHRESQSPVVENSVSIRISGFGAYLLLLELNFARSCGSSIYGHDQRQAEQLFNIISKQLGGVLPDDARP